MSAIARLIESTPITDKNAQRQKVILVGGLTREFDIIRSFIEEGLVNPEKYDTREYDNNGNVMVWSGKQDIGLVLYMNFFSLLYLQFIS